MANTIAGTYTTLVTLGAAIDNPTTITAAALLEHGLQLQYQHPTAVNAGSIMAFGAGIRLNVGGSVTDQSGGAISSDYIDYYGPGALTVVNAGTILGGGGAYGGIYGIYNSGVGAVTVVNAGTIIGSRDAVKFAAGYANRLVIDPGAVFSGTVSGGNSLGATAVSTLELASGASAGTLAGLGTQFIEFAQVTVDAGAQWTLTGANTLAAGYTLTDAGTLTNAGTLSGNLTLAAGGVLFNAATGMIAAPGGTAVYGMADGAATVVNAGVIAGSNATGGRGIDLAGGGSVTNQSGGAISGYYGIGGGGAMTVVNAGTITGTNYAVRFAARYANRLVIDPNAVFSGTVTGGNAIGASQVSTLELASAGSAGTLSGLGTKYVDFAQVTVDAGGRWTLKATDTIEAGVTLTNAGTLSGSVTLAAGGVLSNASTGTITPSGRAVVYGTAGGAATVVNAGVIAGSNAYDRRGIYLAGGGSVTNQSGGTISGFYGIDDAGAMTVVNAGRIVGNTIGGGGVVLNGGGSVTNQSGGTISGFYAINGTGALTVVNAGRIAGSTNSGRGVYLDGGGSVTNQSGGTISAYDGIFSQILAVTVVNAGSITGSTTGVLLNGGGSVTNQSGGTISGFDGIDGSHAMTVVNAGGIAGSTNGSGGVYLKGGGSVTNQSGGVISGSKGIYGHNAAVTVVNAGTIAGTSYAVQFAAGFANRLIADPGAVFTGNVDGGGGVLELASAASAGTLSGFGAATNDITNFSTLQFDAGAAWTVSGNDSAGGLGTIAITGFANGDTIDLSGFVAVSDTFASNTLVLTDAGGAQDTLSIQGAFTTTSFQMYDDGNGGTDVVICFCAGTMIATPTGEVPVEKLKIRDMVLTAHNGPRPVTWIGQGKVLATRGRRSAATPVIVRKGALADNVPNRDLRVTKAHSLYIDDVLIPVEFLVNHRTILWDDRAQEVEIYHVELDGHDVLIANGAPAESYRDDGNRWLFRNANSGWHLPPQAPCAPVLTGGPVVDAAWRRLLDRAGQRCLPPLTEDPDLHLVIDGVRVDPEYRRGSLYGFRLPSSPASVVIASREAVPAEFGIARDPRSLGVALRQIVVRQGAKLTRFDADDDRLTVGFHVYEADGRLRWTDGYAELPAEAFARFDKGAEVMLHLGGATQYPDEKASPARAVA